MRRWSLQHLLLTLALCGAGWAIIAALCLCVGSTGRFAIPDSAQFSVRSELVLLASLVGAALGSSGVVYQSILQNPLADPYLLGVSSGASLAGYLWRFPLLNAGAVGLLGWGLSQQMFAFAGAIIAVIVVFSLAGRRGKLEPIALLLIGVIVNSVNGSIYLFLNAMFRDLPGAGGPLTFLVGGLQTDLQAGQLRSAAICIGVGWIILMLISGQLNIAMLSEAEATALGVRINRLRWIGLIIASLVTAAAVAVSGPIGFIGLICPHIASWFVGQDQRKRLPVATAIGAALLAVADATSRKLGAQNILQTVLPVGVLSGLLGGPFFLILLGKRAKHSAS